MKLSLAYYGDPVLRKKGTHIEEITPEIKKLVEDMIETMLELDGIGLAAPQVFKSLLLFVTRAPIPSEDGKEWIEGPIRVFINPKLSDPSSEGWEASEGCLSIPSLYAPVMRPWKITVEAMDLEGNHFKEELQGWPARVVMHENDHINGILYPDRILGKSRQLLEPKLKDIKKKFDALRK